MVLSFIVKHIESVTPYPPTGPMYRLEKQTEPNVAVDLDSTLETQSTLEFCLVRENSTCHHHCFILCGNDLQTLQCFMLSFFLSPPGSRGEESSEEDPPIDITTVQDMLSSHHYKSFKISMIHKLRFTTDVQLGRHFALEVVRCLLRSHKTTFVGNVSCHVFLTFHCSLCRLFPQAFQGRRWRSILSPIRRPALSSGFGRNPSPSTRITSVPVTL